MTLMSWALVVALWGAQDQPGVLDDPAIGSENYAAGRFAEASAEFSAWAARAPDDLRPLVGLGNAAFRQERYGEAVWHYRRALRRRPGDAGILSNLRAAEAVLDVRRAPTAGARLRRWWQDLAPWQRLLGASLLQGVLAWWAFRAWRSGKLLPGGFCLVGAVAAWFSLQADWNPPLEAVCLLREASVRQEPHEAWPPGASLRVGETVRVVQASPRWVLVEGEGRRGWVQRSALGVVD